MLLTERLSVWESKVWVSKKQRAETKHTSSSDYRRSDLNMKIIKNEAFADRPCDMSPGQSPRSFMPVLTIPDINWTCAVDDPSKVVSLLGVGGFPDVAHCAMQCTGDVDCKGFNLKINASLCEMYKYIPTRFALVPGCQYRQVCENSETIGL